LCEPDGTRAVTRGLLPGGALPVLRGVILLALLFVPARLSAGAGAAARNATPPGFGAADTVVLVSIDGVRWDMPESAGAPTLARIGVEGARAAALVPAFPASTFPAHVTLATGVHPDRHGILNNRFLDRSRGIFDRSADAFWILTEPLWVTAERQGRPAAVYHWVGAATPWHGVGPTISRPFTPGAPDQAAIDAVLGWLGKDGPGRPRLVMAYLHGVDAVAHREGPDSAPVAKRMLAVDRLLGRLLRGVKTCGRSVTLILVSDHGSAAVTGRIRLDALMTGAAARVRCLASGGCANLYCPDDAACAAARERLADIEGMTLYSMSSLPMDLRYRLPERTGDLVAIAPPGSYFAGRGDRGKGLKGAHGYEPARREMQGIFYAWGAGIRPGARLARIDAVDIAPLVCRLLGIAPAAGIDGQVPDILLAGLSRVPGRGDRMWSPDSAPARP